MEHFRFFISQVIRNVRRNLSGQLDCRGLAGTSDERGGRGEAGLAREAGPARVGWARDDRGAGHATPRNRRHSDSIERGLKGGINGEPGGGLVLATLFHTL